MDKKYFDDHLHIALHNFITQSICNSFSTDKEKMDFVEMYLDSNLPIPDNIKDHNTYMSSSGTSVSLMTLFKQLNRDKKLKDLGI